MKNMKQQQPIPFNELQQFYRDVNNRIRGIISGQPVRSMFPVGDMRKNKFKKQ